MTGVRWTNPSVRALLSETDDRDPVAEISRRARDLALTAREEGWSGPPFDPFILAEQLGIAVVAKDDLEDARLLMMGEKARIEFNPNRRRGRVRFSVAHELGHWLFPDFDTETRYRSHGKNKRRDAWQLEMLCNVAAAELLMPTGAFPDLEGQRLNINELMDLRREWDVSTEALLNRVVKLTPEPTAMFAAQRAEQTVESDFRVDYSVSSRGWRSPLSSGAVVSNSNVLPLCTAVGFTASGTEEWSAVGDVSVQSVGIPPYPGDRFPRVVGLIQPAGDAQLEAVDEFKYVRGDATEPRGEGSRIIAHIVNNTARRWGGYGFARSLGERYPDARDEYHAWAESSANRQLGAVHFVQAEDETWVASIVAQAGYGESVRPRIRYSALGSGLRALARHAADLHASIHMPAMGTGQAGGEWPTIRELILEELSRHGLSVTVYILPDQPMPEEAAVQLALST